MSKVSIPEVPSAGVPPLFTAQNGYVTDGPALAALANTFNMIAGRRMKVLYHAFSGDGFHAPGVPAWFGRFLSSPFVTKTYCTILTGDFGLPATQGDVTVTVDGNPQTTQTTTNTATFGNNWVLKTFEVVDAGGSPISAGVHSFSVNITGAAAVRSVVFYESVIGTADTATGAAVDPSQFAVGAPVVGNNLSGMTNLAWSIHKDQSTHHISWSSPVDAATKYKTTGATWKNPLDATTTGYASTAAGHWAYPYRQSSLSETTVPVTCWVYAEAGSNTGRFRLSNSAGVILTITGIGAAGYYTGTGTLDATLATGDLIVPEYSNSTGGATITLWGFGLYNRTT